MQDISLKIGTLAREIHLTVTIVTQPVTSIMTESARLRPGNSVFNHPPPTNDSVEKERRLCHYADMAKKAKKKIRKPSQKTTDWAIGLPLDFPKPKRQSRKREPNEPK